MVNKAPAASPQMYQWAVNVVKLNRAIAYVRTESPTLKAADLEDAVKERYVQLGGLLKEDKTERVAKKGGKVENVAPDDGSAD